MAITHVYLAGPLTKGDVGANIREAARIATILKHEGLRVYLPHLDFFWNLVQPDSEPSWLAHDFGWIDRCDALLRLHGESTGGDKEVDYARKRGVPVFGGGEVSTYKALSELLLAARS